MEGGGGRRAGKVTFFWIEKHFLKAEGTPSSVLQVVTITMLGGEKSIGTWYQYIEQFKVCNFKETVLLIF